MTSKQYTDEFKAEAVKQVTERGFAVAEVAKRLGVSSHSLYQWLRKAKSAALAGTPEGAMLLSPKDSAEVRRLKAEVKRLTEERDILKKAAAGEETAMTMRWLRASSVRSRRSGSSDGSTQHGTKHTLTYSITLRCSTTRSAGMVPLAIWPL